MSAPDNLLGALAEHPAVQVVEQRYPGLWTGVDTPGETSLRCARAMVAASGPLRRRAEGADPLRVELTADLLVLVEAAVVASAAAADPTATLTIRSLTAWRVHRDTAAALAQILVLSTPAERPAVRVLLDEVLADDSDTVTLALDARQRILDEAGLEEVLSDIETMSPDQVPAYLHPAAQAVSELVPALRTVVAEDFRSDDDGVDAALGYLLDPLSACHTAALLIAHAADRMAVGDARAATVARRWCYARVRSTTLEGLTPRHVGKSRQLVRAEPVIV